MAAPDLAPEPTALAPVDPTTLEARIAAWLAGDVVLEVETALDLALEAAPLIDVRTEDDYRRAIQAISTLATARDEARAFWQQYTGPAFRAHRLLTAAQTTMEAPANERETELRQRTGAWYAEQEHKRKAEERRQQEESAAAERAERESQAQALEEQGAAAEAADVRSAPNTAPPVTVPRRTFLPEVAGVTQAQVWTAEVTDLRKLVAAVAAGSVPLKAVKADTRFIRSQASRLQEEMQWPGVRTYTQPQTRVKRR